MITRRLFTTCAILTVAATALTSCSSSAPKPETLPVVELRQEWFPNANFAGEVSASKRFAKDEKIQLNQFLGEGLSHCLSCGHELEPVLQR